MIISPKMDSIKVSVIIPIYNSEEYLESCINSVLSQKYSNFELLLINDGSTDRSGEISDKFATQDFRIKVFHKANGGVSTARNLGVSKALGKWICFIDSDDTVNSNYLQDFVLGVQSYNCDFVVHGFIKYLDNNQSTSDKVFSRTEFINQFHLYPLGPVCKFFCNDILRTKQVVFSEDLSYGEDTLFVLDYLKECNSVLYLNGNNYSYNKVPNSLSTKVLCFDKIFFLSTQISNRLKKMNSTSSIISNNLKYPLGKLLRSIFTDFNVKQNRINKLTMVFSLFYENYLYIFNNSGLKGKVFFTLLKYRKIEMIEFIYKKLYKYA